MSQEAFDQIDKDFVNSKATTDRLLRERRSLMEDLVEDLTPREAFDMRLDQLLLEYPHWSTNGLQEDGGDQGFYTFYIDDCEEEIALNRLDDPQYSISGNVDVSKVIINDYGTYKSVATLYLQFDEEDEDDEEEEAEVEE